MLGFVKKYWAIIEWGWVGYEEFKSCIATKKQDIRLTLKTFIFLLKWLIAIEFTYLNCRERFKDMNDISSIASGYWSLRYLVSIGVN